MGCFDTVLFRCECGNRIPAQSKSGLCNLNTYARTSVPLAVVAGLGETIQCESCGKQYRIVPSTRRVSLALLLRSNRKTDNS